MTKTFYLIIGSGRLAHHLEHYLTFLKLPCARWSRQQSKDELWRLAEASTHQLIAVSDSAIPEVARDLPPDSLKIHFSGASTVEGVIGAHPLMTFTQKLQPLEWYQQIPFALEKGHTLSEVLPGLPNPWFTIANEDRARYHALVSMSGNFANLMWRACVRELKQLKVDEQVLAPFLTQVTANFLQDPESSLTGPIARKDWQTIEQHLAALNGSPKIRKLYESFLEFAKEDLR